MCAPRECSMKTCPARISSFGVSHVFGSNSGHFLFPSNSCEVVHKMNANSLPASLQMWASYALPGSASFLWASTEYSPFPGNYTRFK